MKWWFKCCYLYSISYWMRLDVRKGEEGEDELQVQPVLRSINDEFVVVCFLQDHVITWRDVGIEGEERA